ncbi:DExH-box ATP-dependent RNA helicase DExH8 [Olea europaea var. sylvestris]|uniref:DExH-box ATP-dependent RNA helicase DExH8 n=1 Tax=Olea europaea var. sylvestris TaxID=158386 RepID=UPI000C1D4FF1|nr:DExH-box ATP-dependent RNA helicase DExH8 [Olea europaea var. sylvestris]
MATSPTSSSYSSSSSPFVASSSAESNFSGLPVMALRDRIVEKIMENRVTLIVGETGCGKSSQVPQFLLEENMEPILCTQPRRFAVVAVARMVAKARNCEVGGEVGYHIGHSRVFSARSKIIFKTAGVLLDEMREKGLKALKYKVIILDEVHERSVESDLVLVCVKQFLLKNNDLRVVLMSATADISRYREYFKDLGRGDRVEVLAIPPSTGKSIIYQRKVTYLEQVIDLLGIESEDPSLKYCSGPSPIMAEAIFKPEVHKLIHDLVLYIHKNEPDIEKSILVFLPTFYALEQQWFLLKPFGECFKVHILHRSIDTEQALKAMRIWKSHRKIILATNIAESSVTIPKVGYVIDSCRSLQVYWDTNRKNDSAELVWVSKSQAEQRKGRTGRTCDGHVYRLVTRLFFNQLVDYEPPAILRLSLRQQVLLICCAESRAINDPKVLLQKAMDPPQPDVVDDALNLLVHIRALEKASPRGHHEPTFYGRLLASFSLSFDASILIIKFGEIGMLREGIVFGILMDLQPLPILSPFGQENRFVEYIDYYYSGNSKDTGLGRKEMLYMGNLSAFQFWQRALKDKCRLERLKQILKVDNEENAQILDSKGLLSVLFADDEILHSLHRVRPKFLVISDSLPFYYDPYVWHTCQLECEQKGETDTLAVEDEHLELDSELRRCVAVPFAGCSDYQMDKMARNLALIVKEMRTQVTEDASEERHRFLDDDRRHVAGGASMCKFFINGLCNRGSQCLFSHSLQAKRPVCKFFFSLQGCRNGDSCLFSHESGTTAISCSDLSLCSQDDRDTDAASFVRFFPDFSSDGYILLLDDFDLYFSTHISYHYDSSCIISTSSQPDPLIPDPSGIKIFWGLSHPYQTIMSRAGEDTVPWSKVKCVLWFPRFDHEYKEGQKSSIQTFFEYLAIRLLAESLQEVVVILTMNNIRFSQLQVEKLARDSFFLLRESFPFDESSFGQLFDELTARKSMSTSKPVSYVFDLHPPTEVQFGDYKMLFRQYLHPTLCPIY